MLKIFGIYNDADFPTISGGNDELASDIMNVFSKFRDDVIRYMHTAKSDPEKADIKELFKISDEVRDDILPNLGIRLEDKGKGNPSIWKLEDRAELMK